MLIRMLAVFVVLAFTALEPLGAAADDPTVTPSGGEMKGTDYANYPGSPGSGSGGGGARRRAGPGRVQMHLWYTVSFEGGDADGCWRMSAEARPDPAPPERSRDYAQADYDSLANNGVLWGGCPQEAAQPRFDPAAAARLYWEQVVSPPTPEPLRVQPGYAITGLTAYLEIGGERNPTWTLENPIGPNIVITATPRYVVRWGEPGAAPTQTTSPGRPYPGGPGEVTHAYRYQGHWRITVEAYWTGSWHLEGASGGQGLGELAVPTTGSLDLPVRQLQAVRNR
jgi:hypothetical protein